MQNILTFLLSAILLITACAPSNEIISEPPVKVTYLEPERPLPYPIDYPYSFSRAIENGTRTMSGEPGENYWTQFTDYVIDAELIPEDTLVSASATITYHNNSPYGTPLISLELAQNLHAPGVIRNELSEVTGGMKIHSIRIDQDTLESVPLLYSGTMGYKIEDTNLIILPGRNIESGARFTFDIDFSFKVPQAGASGRMGYSRDNLFHIAYWFPHVAVFDDMNGWFGDIFTGNSEFYHGFGNYEVNFTAPDDWIVMGTGELTNPDETLAPDILGRYYRASDSDTPVKVVTPDDYGNATKQTESGKNTWKFSANNVRDVAYSFVRNYNWDAARSPVGDIDDDGETDYTTIHSFWRNNAPLWEKEVEYSQHAIKFLSEYTGFPYPWPHMTSVEAAGIIGGGMEFPMITIMGSYQNRMPLSLYDVTAHELAHMWIPMIVSTNERRNAWIDEGATTFNEANSRWDFQPSSFDRLNEFSTYLQYAGSSIEGEIIRWSDFHYNTTAYGIASYSKPGAVFIALQGVIGEDTFNDGWKKFINDWAYKHPTPYDLFNVFETVSNRELDWFWRSWIFETWTLDQSISKVTQQDDQATIVVEDLGRIPMPVDLTITFEDGTSTLKRIPVEVWLKGKTNASLTIPIPSAITSVIIDNDKYYPDTNRDNNSWYR